MQGRVKPLAGVKKSLRKLLYYAEDCSVWRLLAMDAALRHEHNDGIKIQCFRKLGGMEKRRIF